MTAVAVTVFGSMSAWLLTLLSFAALWLFWSWLEKLFERVEQRERKPD